MIPPDFVRALPEHTESLLVSVEAYYAFDGIEFDVNRVRAALQQLFESPALAEAWLIRDQAGFAGHFVLSFGFDIEFGGRQATLTELYLEERARGRGFGSAALRFMQDRLTGVGIRTLELQAEDDNLEAQQFYRKAGFVAETRLPFTKRW